MLQLSAAWPGDFYLCVNTTVPSHNWTSKYCSIKSAAEAESSPVDSTAYGGFAFKYGVCAPHECSETDIAILANFGKFTAAKEATI